MQKLKSLFLITALFCAAFSLAGCGSTPEATATNLAATQVTTVDAAMQSWAAWVKSGHATQAQVDAVKAIYLKYLAAAKAEKKALLAYVDAKTTGTQTDWQSAKAALTVVETDLVNLIVTFKGK